MTFRPCYLAAVLAVVFPLSSHAQVESTEVKVTVEGFKRTPQFGPIIESPNKGRDGWKPKTWLEADVTFRATVAEKPGAIVDSLDFKFFMLLNAVNKDGRRLMLTGKVTGQNIDTSSKQHVLVYVSPESYRRQTGSEFTSVSEIIAFGVQIERGGAVVGYWSSDAGQAFWELAASKQWAVVDGLILPKTKTPFAHFWYGYDVESKP